jgi:glutathione S-transferase
MQIYGLILSPFTARVVLAARHKGIKHTLSMPKDGSKTPAFLKMNPLGKTPVIKDGSTVLFESGVILDYLDAKYKKKRIIPAAAKAAAQARLIAALFGEYIMPPIFALWGQSDPAKRDQSVVDAKLADINRALDTIEKLMPGKSYAAGTGFTIADCYAVPALSFLYAIVPQFGLANPLAARKKLNKYMVKAKKDKLMGGVLNEMADAMKKMLASRQ